jgi:hypothetical protein
LTALSRLPSEEERAAAAGLFTAAEDRAAALRDVYWALMNTKEFAFNH